MIELLGPLDLLPPDRLAQRALARTRGAEDPRTRDADAPSVDIKYEKPQLLWRLRFHACAHLPHLHRQQRSQSMSAPQILTFMSTPSTDAQLGSQSSK